MTPYPPIGQGPRALINSLQLRDFDVSWVGPTLANRGFCFGSEDGRLLLADYDGAPVDKPQKANYSGEALNGVAFLDRRIAVSTRNEVLIVHLGSGHPAGTPHALIPFGAHDVIAGVSGHFFAPLGRRGILSCLPDSGPVQEVTIVSGPAGEMYFYRVISLRAAGGEEVLACATRRGGVASMEFRPEEQKHTLGTLTFGGLDVVDICPLVPGEASTAAAALGRDGTVILFRDALHERTPLTVKYPSVKGVAYRLLSAGGNLFLLTSEGLHVITALVDRFLNRAQPAPVTPVLVIPMQAVDANAVGDRWVLIVMADGVLRFDVGLLEEYKPGGIQAGERRELVIGEVREEEPTEVEAAWEVGTVEHRSEVLAGVE
jgi:hypothetical protein